MRKQKPYPVRVSCGRKSYAVGYEHLSDMLQNSFSQLQTHDRVRAKILCVWLEALEALYGMVFAQAQKLSSNSVNIASFCDSLVPRRSLLTCCPREVWEDVTAHGRVQDWPRRERLGTRLILWFWVNSKTDQTRFQGSFMSRRQPWERGC